MINKVNIPREREQVAMEFLDSILINQEIDTRQFYGLLRGLDEVPYLTNVRPTMEGALVGLGIEGKYKGDKEIGRARDPRRVGSQVKPEIQRQVEEIYADLSDWTGYKFHNISPDLRDNYCYAYIFFGENINSSISPKGKLIVSLYK